MQELEQASGLGMEQPAELEDLGKKLAILYQPRPPKKVSQAIELGKVLFDVVKAKPGRDFLPSCQQVVRRDDGLRARACRLSRRRLRDVWTQPGRVLFRRHGRHLSHSHIRRRLAHPLGHLLARPLTAIEHQNGPIGWCQHGPTPRRIH